MPLFRPMTHSGMQVRLSPGDRKHCSACPDAWFRVDFDTMDNGGTQGIYVKLDNGVFRYLPITEYDALSQGFPAERVFAVGRDGYYLTLAEARDAIDRDGVHGVLYVDDYNDEYQDVFVSDPLDVTGQGVVNVPYAESHRAEPIR